MYELILEKKESRKKGVADYYTLSVKKDYKEDLTLVTFDKNIICAMFDLTELMLSKLFANRTQINMGAIKGYEELLTLMTLKSVKEDK